MNDLFLDRKSLDDLIKRHDAILEALKIDPFIRTLNKNTIKISHRTLFLATLKTRILKGIEFDELNQVLGLSLTEDFGEDKIQVLARSLEKPYPKYEPTTGLTTLKFPPDFESHVKGKARKG